MNPLKPQGTTVPVDRRPNAKISALDLLHWGTLIHIMVIIKLYSAFAGSQCFASLVFMVLFVLEPTSTINFLK